FEDANTSTINVITLQNQLAGGNVIVTTGGAGSPGAGNGNINVNSSFIWATGTTLTLSAFHDINVAGGVTISNTNNAGGNLILRANSDGRSDLIGTNYGTLNLGGNFGTVNFAGSTGKVSIYYDPSLGSTGGNKYLH